METLIEPVCSECSTSPWNKHCCTCEPCAQKRIQRARAAAILIERERAAKRLERASEFYGPESDTYRVLRAQAAAIRSGEDPK